MYVSFNTPQNFSNKATFKAKVNSKVTKVVANSTLKLASVTAASLGIVSISNTSFKNNSIKNDELVDLITQAKIDEDNYNQKALNIIYKKLLNLNPSDDETKIIQQYLKTFGDIDDFIQKYPNFSNFFARSIEYKYYHNPEARKEVEEALNKNLLDTDSVEICEKYLLSGLDYDKKDLCSLYNRASVYNEYFQSEPASNYSEDGKNQILKCFSKLMINKKEKEAQHFVELTKYFDEEVVIKVSKNTGLVTNFLEQKEDVVFLLYKYMYSIINSNLTSEDDEKVAKHFLCLYLMKNLYPDNFKKIEESSLYQDLVKNKSYLNLLVEIKPNEDFDENVLKTRVSKYEKDLQNKFSSASSILKDVVEMKIAQSILKFNDEQVKEITDYVDQAKDEDFLREMLTNISLYVNGSDKKNQNEVIRLIKYTSLEPDYVNLLVQTTGNSPSIINSALNMYEMTNDKDLITKLINKNIPQDYWSIAFDWTRNTNKDLVYKYLDETKIINPDELNKRLLLRSFKDVKNFSETEIFSNLNEIESDFNFDIKKQYFLAYQRLLELKLKDNNKYNRIKQSGYFDLTKKDVKLRERLKLLNVNSDLNKNLYQDLTNKSIIKEFDKNISQQEVLKQSKCGDVVEIGNKLFVNEENQLTELKITRQKFMELFPPIERFLTMQGSLGNCYFVSVITAIMNNPKTRANIYKSFEQKGEDIYVTIKAYEDYKGTVKFEDGHWPTENSNRHLKGCKGFQMLEYAYAMTTLRNVTPENAQAVTKDVNPDDILNRIVGGQTHIAFSEILGIDFKESVDSDKIIDKTVSDIDLKSDLVEKEQQLKKIFNDYPLDDYLMSFGTVDKNLIQDVLEARKYNICASHGYYISSYDAKSQTVSIVNPHHAGITTEIPLSEFVKYISKFAIASF